MVKATAQPMTSVEEARDAGIREVLFDWDQGPDDPHSGDAEVDLGTLPAGARVTAAPISVTGRAFHGLIQSLAGATVLASPVVYTNSGTANPSSSTKAYIVDFAGSRSVLGVSTAISGARITLVLPWMGTDFGPKAAYGTGSATTPPAPDATGTTFVHLTGLETMKLFVQLSGSSLPDPDGFAAQSRITTGTFPSNVRASLNGRLPFWSKPGPLSGEAVPTGLVEDLTAVLAEADAGASVGVRLTLTTDTPGVLDVAVDPAADLAFEHTATAKWGAGASTTVAVRALEPTILPVPFPNDGTADWAVSALDLLVGGDFPLWRAVGAQSSDDAGHLGLRVDAGLSVARRLAFEADTDLFGVAALVRARSAAGLRLELVGEEADAPGGGPPLAAVDVEAPAAAPVADASGLPAAWLDVLFDAPVAMPAGSAAWAVLRAKNGSVEWAALPEPGAPETRTLGLTQGGRWERYPAVGGDFPVAQTRMLRRPYATEHEPVLEIAWEDEASAAGVEASSAGVAVRLSRPEGAEVVAAPAEGSATVRVRLTARAAGTVTVDGATATYGETT
jgi:hypothetical protein